VSCAAGARIPANRGTCWACRARTSGRPRACVRHVGRVRLASRAHASGLAGAYVWPAVRMRQAWREHASGKTRACGSHGGLAWRAEAGACLMCRVRASWQPRARVSWAGRAYQATRGRVSHVPVARVGLTRAGVMGVGCGRPRSRRVRQTTRGIGVARYGVRATQDRSGGWPHTSAWQVWQAQARARPARVPCTTRARGSRGAGLCPAWEVHAPVPRGRAARMPGACASDARARARGVSGPGGASRPCRRRAPRSASRPLRQRR
jgi:hypothetical protein